MKRDEVLTIKAGYMGIKAKKAYISSWHYL